MLVALPLAACVATPPTARLAAPTPAFDPLAFFTGRTHGDGMLVTAFGKPHAVRVEGTGTVQRDGTLLLDQDVAEAGKPVRHRRWHIRATGGGRYAGTLSDARGAVAGVASGNRLTLRFTIAHGLRITQRLFLQPGGQSSINRLVVTKFGLPFARLDETIRKLG